MKWPERIAQAFRPGYVRFRIRPEGAAEMREFCPTRVRSLTIFRCRVSQNRFGRPYRANSGGRFPRPEDLGCSVTPFHGEDPAPPLPMALAPESKASRTSIRHALPKTLPA
jgi:hypothetical protein